MTYGLRTKAVLREIGDERGRQDEKFGPIQDIPDGTGAGRMAYMQQDDAEALSVARHMNDLHAGNYATWESVLREEFLEAMTEDDPVKLRTELVQVAAVAVKWVEHIDRRKENV